MRTLRNSSSAAPSLSTVPTLDSQSGAILPTSRSLSSTQPFHVSEGLSSAELNVNAQVTEILEGFRLSQFQAFLQSQSQGPRVESRRCRAALQDQETVAKTLYEHDKAVWLQKAATYERQLQEVSVAHASTEREMRATIDNRLRDISTLKSDLLEKNSTIEGIELRCDKLTTALMTVQEELKGDRERYEAQRQQEMRDLEARLMNSIQVRHFYL